MRFLALSLAVLFCVSAPAQSGSEDGRIAIVHAKAYLDPGKPPIDDATVLIANGKVSAAGARLAVPPGVRVIDAKGQILTPGLMNSDSQLALTETLGQENTDSGVSSGPFGAAFDVEYGLNPNSTVLPVARADGLTRATVLPTKSAVPPFLGQGAVLRLSEGADILDLPRAVVVVQIGGMVAPATGGSRSAAWMLLRRALTDAQKNLGPVAKHSSDKADSSKTAAEENLAALTPVLQGKIPLAIITHRESDLRQAVSIADDYKIHVVLIGAEEAWRIADLLASHNISVVLNPYADAPSTFDQIGSRLDNAAILDRAGVRISFMGAFVHVTYNAGMAIREGAGIAVANGLPWNEALKALTINPAMTWGIAGHYGSLDPGKDADLVLWDGDPLEPMSAPVMVMVRGKEVSLETRQTDLERRYSPASMTSPIPPAYR
ncbi:MAG TPA: amidohydrolase family protein [Bryobacteraceae bacterium]|nr:amidohydrolase family protein [Bryobacteraceae bacterium]